MPVLTNKYLNYNPKLPSTLYHYCSVNTLLSIVEHKSIWLSDAEKTNDYTEMKWLFSKIGEVIEQILVSYEGKYSKEVLLKTKEIAFQTAENLLLKDVPIVQYAKSFLTCFSEASDLLSQWRAYGNDGKGVAIGFNAELFNDFSHGSYYLTKVIYNQEETLKFLHIAIEQPLKWAIESSIDKKTNKYNISELTMNVSMLIVTIWQEGFMYKNEMFSEEREWRLFRKLQSDNYCDCDGVDDYGYSDFLDGFFISNNKYLGNFTRSPLKFRSTENDIRTYFEIGFEKCKQNIINEIIIGPKCKIADLDIKLLLAKNGYIEDIFSDSVKIKKSQCPYI